MSSIIDAKNFYESELENMRKELEFYHQEEKQLKTFLDINGETVSPENKERLEMLLDLNSIVQGPTDNSSPAAAQVLKSLLNSARCE